MDVARQLQKIGVGIDQNRFVASLKKMSCAVLAPIPPTGISKSEILNDPGKANRSDLNGQVHMGVHQTDGMNAVPIAVDALLRQFVET
jgi:hypothetical protein